jgi:hypothetical protein
MVSKFFHCVDILAITSGATEELLRQLLRERDAEGKTPLQLACAADKPDVVLAMLSAGMGIDPDPIVQCCGTVTGSVTFWYDSGSADQYL